MSVNERTRLLSECRGHARFYSKVAADIGKIVEGLPSDAPTTVEIRTLLELAAKVASDAADRFQKARP